MPNPLDYRQPSIGLPPRRRFLNIIVILCLTVGLGLTAIVVVAVHNFDPLGDDQQDVSVARLEDLGHFTLPSGAARIRSNVTGFEDSIVTATFTMPAGQLNSFIQSTYCAGNTATTQPTMSNFLRGQGDSWWTPGTPAKSFRRSGKSGGRCQEILIDQTNPNVFTVWLWEWNP